MKEKQTKKEEIKRLFSHLDSLKLVVLDDVHDIKARRKEHADNYRLNDFLHKNKLSSIKLVSFKDKEHIISNDDFLHDFLTFCQWRCSAEAMPDKKKSGKPKGIKNIISSSFHIIQQLKKFGVKNQELAEYFMIDQAHFEAEMQRTKKYFK